MEVLVSVEGMDKVERAFSQFEKNLVSTETMAQVGEEIKRYNEKQWGRGVHDLESTQTRWPDSEAPLVNEAAAQAAGQPLLRDTFRVKEVTPDSVTYGTDDYRAHFLQYGTKNMKRKRVIKIPRKQIMAILHKALMRDVPR